MQGESCFQCGNVSGYILSDCFVFLHQTLCVCMSLRSRKGHLWDLTFNTVIGYYRWQFSKQGHHLLLPDFQGPERVKARKFWVQKNHTAFRMGQGPGQELEIRWDRDVSTENPAELWARPMTGSFRNKTARKCHRDAKLLLRGQS